MAYTQENTDELYGKIRELKSQITILQAKLSEVEQYEFLLFLIVGVIFFLIIIGTNASFKKKMTWELRVIKKQLIDKYRESIESTIAETEEHITDEKRKILLYRNKTTELMILEKDYVAKDWLINGLELFYAGKYVDAVSAFEKPILYQSNETEAYYNIGITYASLGNREKSAASFKKVLEIKNDIAEAWCHLGIELEKLDKREEAVEAYTRAIEINPRLMKAYEYKGIDLRKLERKEEAVQSYNNMGDALLEMGREDEAVEAYSNMAIDLIKLGLDNPNDDPIEAAVQTDVNLEHLEYEEKALNIYYKKGIEYLKCDRYDEAIEAFDKVINMQPENLDACFLRAKILLRLGREEESLNAFKVLTEKDPFHITAHYFLGKALMTMGNKENALFEFRKVVELKPDYPETYHKLASIYAQDKNIDAMLINLRKYFERSLEGVEESVEKDHLFEEYFKDRRFRELLGEFKSKG